MHTKPNTEGSIVFIFIDSFVLYTEHFIQASERFSSQWHIFVIKGVNSFGVKFFAIILYSSVIYSVHIIYNMYFSLRQQSVLAIYYLLIHTPISQA